MHDPEALRLLINLFGAQRVGLRLRLSISVRRNETRPANRIDETFGQRESTAAFRNSARISWPLICNRRVERRRDIADFLREGEISGEIQSFLHFGRYGGTQLLGSHFAPDRPQIVKHRLKQRLLEKWDSG